MVLFFSHQTILAPTVSEVNCKQIAQQQKQQQVISFLAQVPKTGQYRPALKLIASNQLKFQQAGLESVYFGGCY